MAQRMTATMALRGPDDEGLWISPDAALGHRRLAVIDIDGGQQPMTASDVVLTYGGEVYNYRELRSELCARGHEFRTVSDTEVVLRAYLEWGADLVDRLNGMYAFAIWDKATQELLLVRDRLGIKPLFYYPLDDGLLFGSEPKAILANPLVRPAVSPTGLCGLMTASPTPGETMFAGMYEVKPGCRLRVSRDGRREDRYWSVAARPHEDDLPTTIRTIRELLEDIVERQLISDVPLCMLLSGGLDSSALTALAQRSINSTGGHDRVRSFAVDFTGYAENFQPDDYRETPDGPFVREVVRHIQSQHQDIVLDTERLFDPETRHAVLRAWDLPYQMGDMDISLYLLFQAIRQHSTVALSGEGADEIFGGYTWIHDATVAEVPMYPWLVSAMAEGATPPFNILNQALIQRLSPGEYLMDHYGSALAEVPRLEGEQGQEQRMREIMYLHIARFLPLLLDRKDRMSMAVGLEVRVPFCDHRLVEYVFNTPWSMKICDGREKSLLRKATEDLLPDSIAQRRKAPFPATQDIQYDLGLCAELERIVDSDDAPARPLLNQDEASALMSQTRQGATSPWSRLRLEGVVRTNLWLEEYKPDLGLDLNANHGPRLLPFHRPQNADGRRSLRLVIIK